MKRTPAELVFAFWPAALLVLAAGFWVIDLPVVAATLGGFGVLAALLWDEFWSL